MPLKGDVIWSLIESGRDRNNPDPLVIAPSPRQETLEKSGAASVDVHLGTWFLVLKRARLTHIRLDQDEDPQKVSKSSYVPLRGDFVIHPGSFVLGTTLEWLRLPVDLAAYLIGKSLWGRRGLLIATATGVHPGFCGTLTLELTNVGEVPLVMQPGMPIGQLFLHRTETNVPQNPASSPFAGRRKPALGRVPSLPASGHTVAEGAT